MFLLRQSCIVIISWFTSRYTYLANIPHKPIQSRPYTHSMSCWSQHFHYIFFGSPVKKSNAIYELYVLYIIIDRAFVNLYFVDNFNFISTFHFFFTWFWIRGTSRIYNTKFHKCFNWKFKGSSVWLFWQLVQWFLLFFINS